MDDWPFSDPKNVAVITCPQVAHGDSWIYYVTHDADDGSWQFHPKYPGPVTEKDAIIVSLESIVKIDPTIKQLADLPTGWYAWRDKKSDRWIRDRMPKSSFGSDPVKSDSSSFKK